MAQDCPEHDSMTVNAENGHAALPDATLATPPDLGQLDEPEMPPGPPPAKMAPPPPFGPPPDLPLERAELKRAVEDPSGNSPLGKRLRSIGSSGGLSAQPTCST